MRKMLRSRILTQIKTKISKKIVSVPILKVIIGTRRDSRMMRNGTLTTARKTNGKPSKSTYHALHDHVLHETLTRSIRIDNL